jgi:hypothetical protein
MAQRPKQRSKVLVATDLPGEAVIETSLEKKNNKKKKNK